MRAGTVPQLSYAHSDRGRMCIDLLWEFEAPRLVPPRPLDARARFCDCARTPRVLLLRSSIDFAADHEEAASREKRGTGWGFVRYVEEGAVPLLLVSFHTLLLSPPPIRRGSA